MESRSVLAATLLLLWFFFFQAEDGIRDLIVTGVQTCALPISRRAARKHHRLGARLGRDGGGGGGGATRAVARVHRLRRDRVRFHGAAGLPGAARVRVRAASVRGTAGLARPSAHGRVVSRLRARQGRPPVAWETAGALPAGRAAPARRRPGDHRAPGRTRSTPGPAAARSGFARGLRTARRGERARIGRAPRLRPRRSPPRGRQSVKPRSATVRIAAGQGFWGDWLEAPYRQVTGGPVDYLMMDYLAEVTMSILQKQKARDPSLGCAKDFIPLMERLLPIVAERRIKITANAGGVNPLRLRAGGGR